MKSNWIKDMLQTLGVELNLGFDKETEKITIEIEKPKKAKAKPKKS